MPRHPVPDHHQEGPPSHPAGGHLLPTSSFHIWCDVAISLLILDLLMPYSQPEQGAATTEGIARQAHGRAMLLCRDIQPGDAILSQVHIGGADANELAQRGGCTKRV